MTGRSPFAEERALRRDVSVEHKVLVIDDDSSVGAAIQMMLSSRGCHAVCAPDAETGIKLFNSSKFDLIVIDIIMDGTDGLEVIRNIRKLDPDIPIIAISGFQFRNPTALAPDVLTIAASLGATACLRKPFATQQLMSAINSNLSLKHIGDSSE